MTLEATQLVGFLLPPIIQILNKDIPEKNQKQRFLATLATCLVTALVLNFNKLQLDTLDQVLTSFTLIFAESQAVYKLYFKQSAVKGFIDERLTPDKQPVG